MTEHSKNDVHPLEKIAIHPDALDEDDGNDGKIHDSRPSSNDKIPVMPAALPRLSPAVVKEPALIIDNRMHIVWQSQAAISQIWHDAGSANNGKPTPHILDLLFDQRFKRKVENWRKWLLFFIQQTHHMLTEDQLHQTIQGRDNSQKEILKEMIKQAPPVEDKNVYSGRMRQLLNDGMIASFWVVATQFEEGRYLVFKSPTMYSEAAPAYAGADIEQRFEVVRRLGYPSSMPIFILAARLSNAHTLRTEMLEDEYSRLLIRLYKQAIAGIEKYGGIFHKLAGSEFMVSFLPDAQHESRPLQIIDCALELKGQMDDLAREWKIRKGWLHDLALNMGLHWATEHIGTVSSTSGDHLTAFGDAQHVATTLSRLARDGEIWATKHLINQIPSSEQKKLRFGTFRNGHPHQVLISKCFKRLKDISTKENGPTDVVSGELGAIAATQIFDRQM